MKRLIVPSLVVYLLTLSLFSCQPENADGNASTPTFEYVLATQALSGLNAQLPELQSFVHAQHPDNPNTWLLFGGRTNNDDSNGGLHDMMSCDYGYKAFPKSSFNTSIYAVSLTESNGAVTGIQVDSLDMSILISALQNACNSKKANWACDAEQLFRALFLSTNALVHQDDDDLYVVGGLGPISRGFSTQASGDSTMIYKSFCYDTHNQVAKISVSALIELVQTNGLGAGIKFLSQVKNGSYRFGFDEQERLTSTGGELLGFNNTLYLAGGHNFYEKDSVLYGYLFNSPDTVYVNEECWNDEQCLSGEDCNKECCGLVKSDFAQNYVAAVYPFNVYDGADVISLTIEVDDPISDMPAEKLINRFNYKSKQDAANAVYVDQNSVFRRRDGPILPALDYNPNTKQVEPSLTFYTGVFQYYGAIPAEDAARAETFYPLPWTDAINVHPSWQDKNDSSYHYDQKYEQIYNVYSAPTVVGYSEDANATLYTMILGGIGSGLADVTLYDPQGKPKVYKNLPDASFTNTGMYITRQLNKANAPSVPVDTFTAFEGKYYYGAEAALFWHPDMEALKWLDTEVLDFDQVFKDTDQVVLGYIFGGIEAYQAAPGGKAPQVDSTATGYGPESSAATNKLWQVYLTKTAQ